MGKDEGPKGAGCAVGFEAAVLSLDSETDWTSEGVHSLRDGKGNYQRSHNLVTGADPRSGNDPESKTEAMGCCVTHTKNANSYDELAGLLPAWEKKVRELEKFLQSVLSNDQKIGFLRQLADDDLEQFSSHWSATGGQTFETLRVYAESQFAQKGTARSCHQDKASNKKTENTINLENLGTPARPMSRRQDRSTLAKASRSLTHQACTPFDTKGKGKGGWPINGKEVGGVESKVKAVYRKLQTSFITEGKFACKYTREGKGHADEEGFIDKHVVSKKFTQFNDVLFETVVKSS